MDAGWVIFLTSATITFAIVSALVGRGAEAVCIDNLDEDHIFSSVAYGKLVTSCGLCK